MKDLFALSEKELTIALLDPRFHGLLVFPSTVMMRLWFEQQEYLERHGMAKLDPKRMLICGGSGGRLALVTGDDVGTHNGKLRGWVFNGLGIHDDFTSLERRLMKLLLSAQIRSMEG